MASGKVAAERSATTNSCAFNLTRPMISAHWLKRFAGGCVSMTSRRQHRTEFRPRRPQFSKKNFLARFICETNAADFAVGFKGFSKAPCVCEFRFAHRDQPT